MLHPAWNVAVLRLAGPLPEPAQLAGCEPDLIADTVIANICFPIFDSGSEAKLQRQIFGDISGVKQILPGYLRNYEAQSWKERWLSYLTDDATTIGQKTGSPNIDLKTGRVLGLNSSSDYLVANYSIPAWELAKDPHFRNIGILFDAEPQSAPPAWLDAWEEAVAPAKPLDTQSQSFQMSGGFRVAGSANVALSSGRPSALTNLARWLEEVFPKVSDFRRLLSDTAYTAADRAVRFEKGELYFQEFLAAMDRRGQIESEFFALLSASKDLLPDARRELQKIAESFGIVTDSLTSVRGEQLLSWQSLQALEKLTECTFDLESLSYGTQHRDLLIPQDGDNAYRIVERLSSNPDPAAPEALRWYLERLLDVGLPGTWREAVKDAIREVRGLIEPPSELNDDERVPFLIAQESTPIDVLRRYIAAAASVVRISLIMADGSPQFVATGWLLSPGLVVFPAHCVLLNPQEGFRRRHNKEINELKDQLHVEFDSGDVGIGHVELHSDRLDLALLRLDFSPSVQPLQVSPSVEIAEHEAIVLIHYLQGGSTQFSEGFFLSQDGQDSIYVAPTGPGSAGAPVLNRQGQVVATHRAWRGWRTDLAGNRSRSKLGTAADSMLEWISRLRPDLWNEVQSAQRSLKRVVDQSLTEMLRQRQQQLGAGARVSFYFSVYGQPKLDNVPDLIIGSNKGHVITGTGTQQTVDALAAMPEVLSISPSTSTGGQECHMSVVRTGATAVRNSTGESGANAIIGVIDTGIDVLHRTFLDANGKTRILAFWDQLYRRSDGDTGVKTISTHGSNLPKNAM
ncbi:MAG: trypsin-like peptidase domain-containing protein [Planctomycetaceae bacterium]